VSNIVEAEKIDIQPVRSSTSSSFEENSSSGRQTDNSNVAGMDLKRLRVYSQERSPTPTAISHQTRSCRLRASRMSRDPRRRRNEGMAGKGADQRWEWG
jgi:hypothetical protein